MRPLQSAINMTSEKNFLNSIPRNCGVVCPRENISYDMIRLPDAAPLFYFGVPEALNIEMGACCRWASGAAYYPKKEWNEDGMESHDTQHIRM